VKSKFQKNIKLKALTTVIRYYVWYTRNEWKRFKRNGKSM